MRRMFLATRLRLPDGARPARLLRRLCRRRAAVLARVSRQQLVDLPGVAGPVAVIERQTDQGLAQGRDAMRPAIPGRQVAEQVVDVVDFTEAAVQPAGDFIGEEL